MHKTIFLGLLIFMVAGCGQNHVEPNEEATQQQSNETVSQRRFEKVSKGMPMIEVRRLLGPPLSISEDPEGRTKWDYEVRLKRPKRTKGGVLYWENPASIYFENDKVSWTVFMKID